MVATFWLLGCMLYSAQPLPRPDSYPPGNERRDGLSMPAGGRSTEWVLVPKLERGQELTYRGTFTEESSSQRVQFNRAYRFEGRYFVLESTPQSVEFVALSMLQSKEPTPLARADQAALSVQVERLRRDEQGKLTADEGVSVLPPLDGPPTLEVGAFLEVPPAHVRAKQVWEVNEPGRPSVLWRLAEQEPVNGQLCQKVVGLQQSPEWNSPRADRSAWQRQTTLWIAPRTGLTARVERVIELREPARREPTQRSVMRYELETSLQYPRQLSQDRRQEILQALQFRDTARPYLSEPTRHQRALQALQRRIAYHLEHQPPTPYREAVRLVQRQVEAACRGEVVQVAYQSPVAPQQPRVIRLGEPAPDFLATELTSNGTSRLDRYKGKPVLLVFYHPKSVTARETLQFAQTVQSQFGRHVHVVGLSVSEDRSAVQQLHRQYSLSFPVLFGGGMRQSYAVETTPKLVLLDGTGVVRGQYLGWGAESASEILQELRRWIAGP